MRNLSFGTMLLTVCPLLLIAQAPDTLWSKTYGGPEWDLAYSLQQTTDGGYIIFGNTWSFGVGTPKFENMYMIKTDSLGDTLWTRAYGGSGYDEGKSVDQTMDGGYVVVGNTDLGDSLQWGVNIRLIKTDSLGDTLWTKIYGGMDWDDATSVQQLADTGFIIVGSTASYGAGQMDVWILRTDRNGDTLWTRTYGGPNSDWGNSVQQTSDGGYIVFGLLSYDMWLLKLDSAGDTIWTQTYGGSAADYGKGVQQTYDGGYILVGDTRSFGAGNRDIYLIKTDSLGDTLWTQTYGDTGLELGSFVYATSDTGYAIAGFTNSFGPGSFYVMKTDSTGDTLWTMRFGSSSYADGASIKETADGCYIAVGWRLVGPGDLDIYLIKIASDVGIKEVDENRHRNINFGATIISGPLLPPEGKKCRIFDITGRTVQADEMKPGIYFIEVEGKITQKVVKVR